MVESITDLDLENPIQHAEIHDEARRLVDFAPNGHIAHVTVAMETRTSAKPEYFGIALVAPFWPPVAMRRGKGHAARK